MNHMTLQDLLGSIVNATRPRSEGGKWELPGDTPVFFCTGRSSNRGILMFTPAAMALALPVEALTAQIGVLVEEGPAALCLVDFNTLNSQANRVRPNGLAPAAEDPEVTARDGEAALASLVTASAPIAADERGAPIAASEEGADSGKV